MKFFGNKGRQDSGSTTGGGENVVQMDAYRRARQPETVGRIQHATTGGIATRSFAVNSHVVAKPIGDEHQEPDKYKHVNPRLCTAEVRPISFQQAATGRQDQEIIDANCAISNPGKTAALLGAYAVVAALTVGYGIKQAFSAEVEAPAPATHAPIEQQTTRPAAEFTNFDY